MGKQMSKYRYIFDGGLSWDHLMDTGQVIFMRDRGDIPNCAKAHDIFVTDKDGYLTIKNPAPKYRGTAYET